MTCIIKKADQSGTTYILGKEFKAAIGISIAFAKAKNQVIVIRSNHNDSKKENKR